MRELKILIVDDNSSYQDELLNNFRLSNSSCHIFQAYDGKEAMVMVGEWEFDIILLDIIMPRLDGIGFLKQYERLYRKKRDTKIICLSGFNNSIFIQKIMNYGVDYYLIKPQPFVNIENIITDLTDIAEEVSFPDVMEKIEVRLEEMLTDFGIKIQVDGFEYLKTAVMLSIEKPDILKAVTKELYPNVAKQHLTSPQCVERSIRHSIEVAWRLYENYRKEFNQKRDCCKYTKKPTNSQFISNLSHQLRRQMV